MKYALVTGGSRGIGRAIAIRLAQTGLPVVINYVSNEAAAAETKNEIEQAGGQAELLRFDVSKPEEIERALGEWEDSHPDDYIGVLVNNAGITRDTLAMRMKDEDWNAVLETNLTAVFRMSRAVMRPMMKQRYGRIVNITSVVGATGNPGQANYAAAKAGVAGMTRALARELASRGVTVNCVAPGFIATDMTAVLPEEQQKALAAQIPMGRMGTAEEVAHAVAWLASPGAAYVTGQQLHVNGGMFMD